MLIQPIDVATEATCEFVLAEVATGSSVLEVGCGDGEVAAPLTSECARYLGYEAPRPGIVLTEHCAGIGEVAPTVDRATAFPTEWRRDDWRFACARLIVAAHPEDEARIHALRHLLYAPAAPDRLRALEAARRRLQQPRAPWDDVLVDLQALLLDDDREVVREALITIGLSEARS